MTKYKTGVGNVTLSGTDGSVIGGQTWQKNGRVRQHLGTIIQPNSVAQSRVKAMTTLASEYWGTTLSAAQRALWIAAAGSGDWPIIDELTGATSNPTGAQLFFALNANAALVNQDAAIVLATPAPKEAFGDSFVTSVVLDISLGTVTITYTGSAPANETHVFMLSAPQSPGKMAYKKSKISYVASDVAVSPVDISNAYINKYGVLTGLAGYNVYWTVLAINGVTSQKRVVAKGVSQIIA